MQKGDVIVGYPMERLARRHLIFVRRVARDQAWADIQVTNWAVAWTKRQPLQNGDFGFPYETADGVDIDQWYDAQQADHMAMLAETGFGREGTDA